MAGLAPWISLPDDDSQEGKMRKQLREWALSSYRTGVLQPLAMLAWRGWLPGELSEGQVRAAMTAVIENMFGDSRNYNKKGFLTLGFNGSQPEISDYYTNNGSLYMASLAFLPLGLPADDPFWTSEAEDWTSKKPGKARISRETIHTDRDIPAGRFGENHKFHPEFLVNRIDMDNFAGIKLNFIKPDEKWDFLTEKSHSSQVRQEVSERQLP